MIKRTTRSYLKAYLVNNMKHITDINPPKKDVCAICGEFIQFTDMQVVEINTKKQ